MSQNTLNSKATVAAYRDHFWVADIQLAVTADKIKAFGSGHKLVEFEQQWIDQPEDFEAEIMHAIDHAFDVEQVTEN